jgi:CTP:phosphocholine cytidylyltransferase-like protein
MIVTTSPSPLSFVEFEVLMQLTRQDGDTVSNLGDSLIFLNAQEIQHAVQDLLQKRLIQQSHDTLLTTPAAQLALEPYRVKRAVILAAGRGERLRPETDTIPKPMVRVHHKRLIETQLDALVAADIRDVTIVRGYKGDMFDELLETYPYIKFIDNPRWDSTGGIVSAALAVDKLAGAYLIEGDFFVKNPAALRPYEYRSSYCGTLGATHKDWFFSADQAQKIHALSFGDSQQDDYKFIGIMYWAPPEAKQLKIDLQTVLQTTAGLQSFIEAVPFNAQSGTYNIFARRLIDRDVTEIDTHAELLALRAREQL